MLRLVPPGNHQDLFSAFPERIHSAAACRMQGKETRRKFENEWNRMAKLMNDTDMLLRPTKSVMNTNNKDIFKVRSAYTRTAK